jgi:hypothetical protein
MSVREAASLKELASTKIVKDGNIATDSDFKECDVKCNSTMEN